MSSKSAGRTPPTLIVALFFAHAAGAQGIGSLFSQGRLPFASQNGAPSTAFQLQCDHAEKVLTLSCTGAFNGVIGGFASDDGRPLSPALVSALKTLHIQVLSHNTASGLDQGWEGIRCQLHPENVQWFPNDIPKNPVISVGLVGCNLGNATWRIDEVRVFNLPGGPEIGAIGGIYRGNAGDSVTEGSFLAALVERYGQKNCDLSNRNEYCRADHTKITVIPAESDNPNEAAFQITLSDDSLQDRALSAARERARKLTTQAAVNKF